MQQVFSGQAALVTGAGVGIGYEIARRLALNGASVVLNDIDPQTAAEAAQRIVDEGGVCQGVQADVGDVDSVRRLVAEAVSLFGRLDIAVANAGITVYGDFFDYTPQQFDKLVSVNLRGTYFLAQAAARQMRAQGQGGRILFTSSVTGHQAIQYLTTYGMSKAALEMLARGLVAELSRFGITVNCIAPGATVTPRNLVDDPDYERSWGRLIPMGRACTPEDMAHAAAFLLSPDAAQITGQTLVVDGGWSAISPTPGFDFVQTKSG
jgi:glucose 1-dehydrogenase